MEVKKRMSEDIVVIEENEDKTITTIRMNNLAKKNAFGVPLAMALREAFDKVERSDARVVILTGGEDVFSSGIDLMSFSGQKGEIEGYNPPNSANPHNMRYFTNTWLHPILSRIENMEKPVIAKIKGYCWGIALEMALACDFRFAMDNSSFCLPEANMGFNPDVGGLIRATRVLGIAAAKDIILTARKFDGNEAFRLGVINGVAKTSEELETQIKNYTDELIDSAPLAVGLSKRLIDMCYGQNLRYGMDLETLASSYLLQTKDSKAGAIARLQRTKPKWSGK